MNLYGSPKIAIPTKKERIIQCNTDVRRKGLQVAPSTSNIPVIPIIPIMVEKIMEAMMKVTSQK